jgi:RHS repeat-associated protein
MIGEVDKSSGGTLLQSVTFRYDVFGDRIAQTVTGSSGNTTTQQFAWDGPNIWADLDANGSLTTRHVFGVGLDHPLARIDASGNLAFYLSDHLGSITDIVNGQSGALLDHLSYDAWGNVTGESNPSVGDRYKAFGYQQDATGNYYDGAREYGSVQHGFLQQDPMGLRAGPNPYEYVGDDPTNATDPSGCDIIIGGRKMVSSDQAYIVIGSEWARTKHEVREAFGTMFNSKVKYEYSTLGELMADLEMRDLFIHSMKRHAGKNNGCTYRKWGEGYKTPEGSGWRALPSVLIYKGNDPAKAIEQLEKGPSKLECTSMTQLCMWWALKETLGDEEFNRRFKNQEIKLGPAAMEGPWKTALSSTEMPGDWVYFSNFPDYSEYHPTGFWSGENAICLSYKEFGRGEYCGFGITKTEGWQLRMMLFNAYNEGLYFWQTRTTTEGMPLGLSPRSPNVNYGLPAGQIGFPDYSEAAPAR